MSPLGFSLSVLVIASSFPGLCLAAEAVSPSRFSSLLSCWCAALTTAGRARERTGVMAPPPTPPASSLRVGSKRPRRACRAPGEEKAEEEAAPEADEEADAGSTSDEMMGAGDGMRSLLVSSSGVRSSDARMRCAV